MAAALSAVAHYLAAALHFSESPNAGVAATRPAAGAVWTGLSRAAAAFACCAAAVSGFAGCAGVVEVTATADSQGVQLTERINYAQALAALSSLLAPQRRALGLPDFTLTPSDSPTALGLTK